MPYNATVYRVMISSPNDVDFKRDIIREVLSEWNATNSEARKVVLLPVGWETHSSPEMGGRPQEILNRQLRNCDLLVGVFWTRIGTPTGRYPSGSVEEIQEHIKSGKPAMIYFSSEPVDPSYIDHDQYNELLKFKQSCESSGLCGRYSDPGDFRSKFRMHLQNKLNSEPFTEVPQSRSVAKQVAENAILDLSKEAQILLKEASQDQRGDIFHYYADQGLHIKTNNRPFVNGDNPREEAKWDEAFEELKRRGFIKDRGSGEIFNITGEGYKVADNIQL